MVSGSGFIRYVHIHIQALNGQATSNGLGTETSEEPARLREAVDSLVARTWQFL